MAQDGRRVTNKKPSTAHKYSILQAMNMKEDQATVTNFLIGNVASHSDCCGLLTAKKIAQWQKPNV